MAYTNSPNMGLPIPGVGTESGPNYAIDVNSSLTFIDQHDHTPGHGVLITPNAININTALTFNNNKATNVAGIGLTAQASAPTNSTIYESGNDLHWVNGAGLDIQITNSSGVAGSPGSIANLVAPASASYVAGNQTFVWQSNTNIAANMDFGSALLRNLSPNSTYALTLSPPNSLSVNYGLILPPLPASDSKVHFLTMTGGDSSGTIGSTVTVDGNTLVVSSNTLLVQDGGISTAQLALGSVNAARIQAGTITTNQISAAAAIVGTQLSPTANITASQLASATQTTGASLGNVNTVSGSPAGVNFAIVPSFNVTQGRPVLITFSGDPSIPNGGQLVQATGNPTSALIQLIYNNTGPIAQWNFLNSVNPGTTGVFTSIWIPPVSGPTSFELLVYSTLGPSYRQINGYSILMTVTQL